MPKSSPRNEVARDLVSVVVVNYRGALDTIQCIAGLNDLDWPAARLQIIVVDNASGDGSAAEIAAAAPHVTLVASEVNTGFAGGCNLGVQHAHGDFVALINSDARPHALWLTEAVAVLRSDRSVGAVASKVLDWDGTRVDYAGGAVNFVGQAYKLEAGRVDDGSYDDPRDVLFPTGSAAVFRADVYRELGGFDEQYFMFFEDVDLGWRMNLRGYRVRYVPSSIVFHRHHAAIAKFGGFREQYLLARNSLITIYKNFSDETLDRVLAASLLLTVRNGLLLGATDSSLLDLERTPGGDDEPDLVLSKQALTGAFAVDYLMSNLDSLSNQRAAIQNTRRRSDPAMASLFGDLLQGTSAVPGFHRDWLTAIKAFRLDEGLMHRRRIVIITADTLSAQMAGPAIRAFHIAAELSSEHDVTLVSTVNCTIADHRFVCKRASDSELKDIVGKCDIVIFQGFVMYHAPWLADTEKIIVVDVYDPMHLEQLEQGKADEPANRAAELIGTTAVINAQLIRGDFFLCASEEQRHFWLGQLAAVGRLNPENYDRDSSLASLIDVAPFGLEERPPVRTRAAIKGVVPGIGGDDKVVFWGGGVYNWFDPLTLISAVDRLRQKHKDVRLFFLGMKHPNPNVPEMRMARDARRLADDLGLTDKFVFFNEQWVDYDDRENYLLDADVGVSTHFLHVETTFAFRTRILDYLWAGLPIVSTEGDSFGRLIHSEGLGVTVPERDVEALAEAIERTLYDVEFASWARANVARVREDFRWTHTLLPLLAFCRSGTRAADSGGKHLRLTVVAPSRGLDKSVVGNIRYARIRLREGGIAFTARHGAAKVRRLLARREPSS